MKPQLTAADLDRLKARWIPKELATEAGIYRVTNDQAQEMMGRKNGDFAGVVIPYRRPGADRIHAYRIRRDKPDVEFDKNAQPKEVRKYINPPQQRNVVYFPPRADPESLQDHTVPIVITEGEFKTLALWRLANQDSVKPMFLPLGIGGVWNWRGVVARADNANGERVAVKGMIPDLDAIKWKRRKVCIAFDADTGSKEMVAAARRSLTSELHKRQALLAWLEWAADTAHWQGAKGIDDLLAAAGPEKVLGLYQRLIYRSKQVTDDSPFQLTESGVLYIDRSQPDRPPARICGKLEVLAKTRDKKGEDWGRLLSWTDDDGGIHRAAMPMTALGGDGAECRDRLLAGGLYISPSPKARALLSTYVATHQVDARTTCVDRIGWHDDAFVLPHRTIGTDAADDLILQTAREFDHSITTSGTLDEWKQFVGRPAAGNSRLVFAISCAFAGPLLMPCGVENGGVHFYGGSSTGKSTTLYVGGSVIGGNERSGFVQSWRNTTNGLEAIAEAHNDLALFLDELAQINAVEAADIAYMLGNGAGKGRMTKTISTRRKLAWTLLFVSSGEITLADHAASAGKTTKAGAEIRLLNIPADAGAGMGIFENIHESKQPKLFAQRLAAASRAYYGTALIPYIEYLTKNRIVIAAAVKEARARFAKAYTPQDVSGEVHRAVDRFALIAAAGELAAKCNLTGWKEGEATDAARKCLNAWLALRGSTTAGDEEAGVRQVRHFLEKHDSRFQAWNADSPPVHNRAGFKHMIGERMVYFVLPEVWAKEVCANFDPKAVAKALIDRGHIKRFDEGRETVKPHVPAIGAKPRLYQVESSIMEA